MSRVQDYKEYSVKLTKEMIYQLDGLLSAVIEENESWKELMEFQDRIYELKLQIRDEEAGNE